MTSTTWTALRDALRNVAPNPCWYRLAHWGFQLTRAGAPLYTFAQWKVENARLLGIDWELPFEDFRQRLILAAMPPIRRRREGD